MAVTNGWGKGVINNTNGYGKLATNNIGAGSIYENSYSGDTALIGTSAAFLYSKSSFNQGEADPIPTITGTAGGSFNADAGVVFVDTGTYNSSTGQIDLSATSIGSHIITYTVNGVQSGQTVGVTAAPYSSTRSFSFDGLNDYFDIPENVYSSAFSFSFWMKPSNVTNKAVMGDITNNSNFIRLDSTTSIKFKCAGGALTFTESSGNDILLNTWQNIIITRDNSNVISMFRNGSSFGSAATLTGNFTLNSIGVAYQSGGWFFSGNLDEVSIWDTALSSDAVTEIYNSGAPSELTNLTNASSSNLKAWYKMGE